MLTPVPMVRCRLVAGDEGDRARDLRYVPASEFELWRYYMETKHARAVDVEEVSVWVPETSEVSDEHLDADLLEPVVRIRFENPGAHGVRVPVERFVPAETRREAESALLAHFDVRCRWSVEAKPGYFISKPASPPEPDLVDEVA